MFLGLKKSPPLSAIMTQQIETKLATHAHLNHIDKSSSFINFTYFYLDKLINVIIKLYNTMKRRICYETFNFKWEGNIDYDYFALQYFHSLLQSNIIKYYTGSMWSFIL